MRKILSFISIFILVFCLVSPVFAVDGYSFDLQYTGTIVKNQVKDANVLLIGVNAPAYTNVIIKVDVTGPATPTILATDTTGVEHDIAQLGFWGPTAGFPVQGDFTNTTPIKATFPEEGNYTITLTLQDVNNSYTAIASRTFTIQVYEDNTGGNIVGNVVDNTVTNAVDNTIEELPKTGTSVVEYVMYIMAVVIVISIVGIYLNKRRTNG